MNATPTPTATLRRIVIVLMAPTVTTIIAMAMFSVAVPFIRSEQNLTADTASWLLVAYTLPYMMLMPLYGRLGDGIGRRRLMLAGVALFCAGSGVLLFVESLPLILVGRAVQGAGAAGVNPLAMATIIEFAPPEQRGKAVGTWNSSGPVAGLLGPLIAGPLIDSFGWRSVMVPTFVVGAAALILTRAMLPESSRSSSLRHAVRSFDWIGVALFNGTVAMLVFFTSSRPITGVEPLRDLRLLGAGIAFLIAFVWWSRTRTTPFIDLTIFRNRNFTFASICVSFRMMLMGGASFLMPLFVTDIYGLAASATGSLLMLHAGALLITMWIGGIVVDRWKSRTQIVLGLGVESVAMLSFLILPTGAPVAWVFAILAVHGLGAGLCLAALHVYALSGAPRTRSATAAGLYSMIRFSGSMLGAAIGGVVLYSGLERFGITVEGYRPAFLFYLIVSLLGAGAAFGLTRRIPESEPRRSVDTARPSVDTARTADEQPGGRSDTANA
ncbi:MAG: MFS transporter [Spirochaetaceae bacterium]|nr:MAG: MFS transporter [Spirochaetaceae bacterium]